MRITVLVISAIMYLCVMFTITGCGHIAAAVINTAIDASPNTQTPIFGKKERFIPKPSIDTKETIIQELGQPNDIIVVDANKKVLTYETYHGRITHLYALKNEIYQNDLEVITTDIKEDKAKGILKSELVKIFSCFQEAVATYTPQKGHSLAQVTSGMGRPWIDRFELKDENGDRMENSVIIAYDIGNGQYLVIGLIDDEVTRVKKFPAYAYYTYKQDVAYMVAKKN